MSAGDWKEMFEACRTGDLALVACHVDAGVDIDHVHPEFLSTPLVASILAGQEAVALYLLDRGADPDRWSEFDGMRPMQAARTAGLRAVEDRLCALGIPRADAPRAPPAPAGWIARLLRRRTA